MFREPGGGSSDSLGILVRTTNDYEGTRVFNPPKVPRTPAARLLPRQTCGSRFVNSIISVQGAGRDSAWFFSTNEAQAHELAPTSAQKKTAQVGAKGLAQKEFGLGTNLLLPFLRPCIVRAL